MAEPTVAAGYAKALMDFAIAKGASRAALVERSQIDPNDLLDQDARIPFESYVALMKASKALCSEPALALQFGAATLFTEISIVGLICHAADTMAEAFDQMNRYGQLVVEVDRAGAPRRFEIARDGDEVWIEDRRANPNAFPELTESTFARFICEHTRYFGDAPFVKAVHVTHPTPEYHAEYDRILQAPVVFDSDRNSLLIHESWLSIEIPPANRYVFGILSERADTLLKSLENSKSVRGRVESLLIPILHTGDASMGLVAKKMGLSRQTLYRKLKDEGVRYEKLLDELRHQMALHYLGNEKLSVTEAAYLVGYSEPTAFSRAFKRWTGASPRQAKIRTSFV